MTEHVRGEEKEKTWREYLQPKAGEYSCIVKPTIAATSFQIDPNFITLLQNNVSFRGREDENPHTHIADFEELCDTFRLEGVPDEAVRLKLFPLTLKEKAKSWWRLLPPNSLRSWEDVTREFLMKYFPPLKAMKMRRLIKFFEQEPTESLSAGWERFKELLGQCPHHDLPKSLLVHFFYNGALESIRHRLDAALCGSFEDKDPDEAYNMLEAMAETDTIFPPEEPHDPTPPYAISLYMIAAKLKLLAQDIYTLKEIRDQQRA